ncbi:MAG: hypothetical protein NWE80_01675, partial [Candidatus Bathyarchaeota archaeon]|nr:hypothetical protein [Candidatus Bathyarchaeota archaeon]
MNRDPYAITLNKAMTEIKKAYPEIQTSFIFTKNRDILTEDQEIDQETINKLLESFENLKEKTEALGKLKSFTINAKNGNLTLSKIRDMHLLLASSKNADKGHIHSITKVIIPTILKTLETFDLTCLQFIPPKELVVETLTGFFTGDSVQIEPEILIDWRRNNHRFTPGTNRQIEEQNNQESINYIKIETLDGHSTLCKVKEIEDQKLKG